MNKLIIGLLAATVAAGTAVVANPVKKVDPGDWWAQDLSGRYLLLSTPYMHGLCLPLSDYPCAFYELNAGFGHTGAYNISRAQALQWEQMGYLERIDTKGVYWWFYL